jgi:hypothetical protein
MPRALISVAIVLSVGILSVQDRHDSGRQRGLECEILPGRNGDPNEGWLV